MTRQTEKGTVPSNSGQPTMEITTDPALPSPCPGSTSAATLHTGSRQVRPVDRSSKGLGGQSHRHALVVWHSQASQAHLDPGDPTAETLPEGKRRIGRGPSLSGRTVRRATSRP